MPFNQQGQTVHGSQYNAEGDMYIGGAQNASELGKQLEQLKLQLVQARQQGALDADTSTEAEEMVDKALQQTKKPQPNKTNILNYLHTAKGIIEGVASASGIVATLVHVVESVQRLF